MSYKDRSGCAAWEDCADGDGCYFALTPTKKAAAKAAKMNISQVEKRECFREKEKKDE